MNSAAQMRRPRVAPAPPDMLSRPRALALFGALALLFVVLLGRSLHLQWFDNDFLQGQGAARSSRAMEIPAHRGRIVDRFGDALAISTPVKSLWAFPDQLGATPAEMGALAQILETTPQKLAARLAADEDFAFLARGVAPETAERAMALRIKGLNEQNEYRRYYPGGEVTAHIVGFTGDQDRGQEGMELSQQAWLGGAPGSRRVVINRRGDVVEDVAAIRAPRAGRDLALSIDSRLQYLAFRELKAAVQAQKADAGGLVILDAHSGEILALANWPTYNPNSRNKVAREKMRNRALTDTFEPGSTMKPFTIATALEAGIVRPDSVIHTEAGALTIGPNTIHDAHPAGPLTVEQVIQKSSNVGAAKIGLQLPPATLWKMFSEAGFGTPPATGFPGEVSGRLRAAKTWKPIEQATMSYGHGLSVNLVQMARAYTIFATDGELKPVTLLKTDGPVAGRPVIKPQTARAVRHMLELATQPGGTAPKAQVPGYRVGGKTGTARKNEGGQYTHAYVSSFVGLAPASNPRLIVAVMLDNPQAGDYYGGTVAGPVFSAVMGGALRLLAVPTDAPVDNVVLPPPGADIKEETWSAPGTTASAVAARPAVDVVALLARLAARPRRITADSRRVEPGVAFAAYPGVAEDGRAYIPDALARGAAGVLFEPQDFPWQAAWQAPHVAMPGLRSAVGAVADFLYGSPSQDLWMVGVTGTNGKTSCAHWIAHALDACGRRAAILGTLGNGFVGALAPASNTTPDACVLHEVLAQLRSAGAAAVAMEVSSHGLDQGRVNGVAFDVALFTNLSRDHLDYHGTMAAYGAAKARLFAWPGLAAAVVNVDDPFGRSLADDVRRRGVRTITYGSAGADIVSTGIAIGARGLVLSVATPWGRGHVETALIGAFNAINLLGVLGVLVASDVSFDVALAALRDLAPPAGRMQRLGGDDAPLVVVDYAHTPDALEKALAALRPAVRPGRSLAVVFGCGGDRDKGKRPLMGRVAASLADRVVVTSDNPRSEAPQAIAQSIVEGIHAAGNRRYRVELDRAAAIRLALGDAGPGDVVLIAGKGHEPYQEIAGRRLPFSDVAIARGALAPAGAA